jgi:4-amino-4-deoxy-L-arabinose transferase-like glycosyltransferase
MNITSLNERIASAVQKLNLPLVGICLLGLTLRIWSIRFGLPYLYNSDEPVPVIIALRVIQTGNLDPQFFNWPSLLMYLNATVYYGYFILGKWAGMFTSPADFPPPDIEAMAVGRAAMPEVWMLGRGISAIAGTLSVICVYMMARQMRQGRWTAWLAALIMAVDPINIRNSQLIRPDTLAVLFLLLTALFALKIADAPRLEYYLLGGVAAGLAAASKYNAGLGFVALLAAHWYHFRTRAFFQRSILAAILAALIAFACAMPYAVLDPHRFLTLGILEDATHYSGGHAGAEGNTSIWYLTYLWSTQGWTLILALASILSILYKRDVKGIVLLSFPVIYYPFINHFIVRSEPMIMPVIPFLFILVASAPFQLTRLLAVRRRIPAVVTSAALLGIGCILVLPPLITAIANNRHLLQPDGREFARLWIDSNLPVGSRIALESYSPYADRNKFVIQGLYGLQEHTPEWYVDNGFEYLVFSQGMYDRYFLEPERYPAEVSRYKALFSRFQPVASFDQNGFEIRVYRTGVSLPQHRVAARFGQYNDVIELVGYDEIIPWREKELLRVRLYWRSVSPTAEPLNMELRLLGGDNSEVGSVQGDLYQGTPVAQGVFAREWSVPITSRASPGLYRLQIGVLQTRFSYHLPARTWAEEPIEPVMAGPFKLTMTPPSPGELQSARSAIARWGDEISLVGYRVADLPLRGGESLPISFYWLAQSKLAEDYTSFIHLLDASGKISAQIDAQPLNGTYPTSVWDKAEIVRDQLELKIPADLPPGDYRIAVGWYKRNLIRLPVMGPDGQPVGDVWMLPNSIHVVQ